MKMNRTVLTTLAGAAVTGASIVAFKSRRTPTLPYGRGVKLKKSVTINRPAEELYRHWRNLESLPTLVGNLKSVEVENATHSCWKILTPGGMTLSWHAEITVDRENEMIGWRSLPHSDIDLAGYIRFEQLRFGRGTVVRVALQYNPPAGRLGALVAGLIGERPEMLVDETLRRFKELMETGEFSTATGENVFYAKPVHATRSAEPVQAASEDSFPASDAPAWTGTTGMTGSD
jgi:uncharacterized membrane protein